MPVLRVFVSHSMSAKDSELTVMVTEMVKCLGCEVLVGSAVHGSSLSGEIQRMIRSCHILLMLATVRREFQLPDGKYAIAPWLQQELAYAEGRKLKIIPCLERGIGHDQLKIVGDIKYIAFERSRVDKLIVEIAKAIRYVQSPGVYLGPVLTRQATGRYVERWGKQVGGLLESAMSFISEGNHLEARRILREAIRVNAKCWTAYVNMGTSFLETEEPKSARLWYNRILKRCPDSQFKAKAYHNLGVIREYMDGDRDDRLIKQRLKLFRKALKLDPNYINTMFSVFITLVYLQEYEKAMAAFRESFRHKGFVDHIRKFLPQSEAELLRRISENLDPMIMTLAFPKKDRKKKTRKRRGVK